MVGGGSRRDEGSLVLNNTNVFAALDTRRKKKKSDKDRKGGKGSSNSKENTGSAPKEPEPQKYWTPAPLNAKSWADVDDEDEDDYYATSAPAQDVWAVQEHEEQQQQSSTTDQLSHAEVRHFICFNFLFFNIIVRNKNVLNIRLKVMLEAEKFRFLMWQALTPFSLCC